jgi:hydroxymethylbilane synthase
LRHARPDLELVEIRGNVPTRIEKLDRGEYDAVVLAVAGLTRLGLSDRIAAVLRPPLMYPAVGQGALGLECREDDADTRDLLGQLNDPVAWASVVAERVVLAELRAGCHAPVGTLSTVSPARLRLEACVLSRDGRERVVATATGPIDDPAGVGHAAARQLLHAGASLLLKH